SFFFFSSLICRNLYNNRLTTLSWQLFHTLRLSELQLEKNRFNCSCDIRWIQLWQARGEAKLGDQEVYCNTSDATILLQEMNITQCAPPENTFSWIHLTIKVSASLFSSCRVIKGILLPSRDSTVLLTQSVVFFVFVSQTNINWANVHAINLTLVNVSRDDNGFPLICIAENVVGITNATVMLTVYYAPLIISLIEPEKRHDHCIEFVVRGNPLPTISWLRNGNGLQENDFIYTDIYDEVPFLEGCLLFRNPTHFDNGNYTLLIENDLGAAKETVYAHFLRPPFTVPDYGSPTPPISLTQKPEEDAFGVSIAVGLAAFACVLLVVLFIIINKYGRRSKFGMK
uniref:LRRCT domain-containing protein n=1 Tax=Latimeria chalumnae TaxID=7897 RepID=H3BCE1_LATCH